MQDLQVPVNNMMRTIIGVELTDRVRKEELHRRMGFYLLKQMIAGAIIMETWKMKRDRVPFLLEELNRISGANMMTRAKKRGDLATNANSPGFLVQACRLYNLLPNKS